MTLSPHPQASIQNFKPARPSSTNDPIATLQELLLGSDVTQCKEMLAYPQIDPARLEVSGKPHAPQDIPSDAPSRSKRCVSFFPIAPQSK